MDQEQQILNIRISVRDLVEFILRSGDIDNRKGGGPTDKEAMQEGSRIHRKIQGRMGSNYRAEVPLALLLPGDGYVLSVEGRADGIFHENGAEWEKLRQEYRERDRLLNWMEPDDVESAAKTDQIEMEDMKQSGLQMARWIESESDDEILQIQEPREIYCIDEIKTTYRDLAFLSAPYEVHLAQAKCYAYIYALQNDLKEIGVQMTYCNLETEDVRRFRQWFPIEALEFWFQALTDQYRKWAEYQKGWKEIRQASLKELEFPFDWRKGQKKVASDVYRTMLRKKTLFIQAPTGTGKTISTVFPAVKAVGEGLADRIFYATAKTITRTVAEETFAILRGKGMRLKTLTITAKEKICPCEETECNPDHCPYAKGHYDRVNDAVFEMITSGEVFDRDAVLRQAEKWMVCPFEMSLDVSLWTDAIICDYNYIFDPRARLKRFFAEGVKGEYLFLIDEAHNLVDRGREMFSAALYKEDFLALKRAVKPYSRKIMRALDRCNSWMLDLKRESEGLKIHQDVGTFPIYLMNLCGVIEEFLEASRGGRSGERAAGYTERIESGERAAGYAERIESGEGSARYTDQSEAARALVNLETKEAQTKGLKKVSGTEIGRSSAKAERMEVQQLTFQIEDGDSELGFAAEKAQPGIMSRSELNKMILDLYFQARAFLDVCDRLDENYVIYSEICDDKRFLLKLYCVDVSVNLQECLDKGKSTIFFSATLLPIQYYKSLLSTQKDNYAIYAASTFDADKRLVLLGTDTSSRYTNRTDSEYRKMARYVLQTIRAKRGNYMVFFSSYRMMEEVAEQFTSLCEEEHEAVALCCQTQGMTEMQREEFLLQFEEIHPEGLAGFCVMGGIFGEGIDLKEERLIGAVVIGTGLPQVCQEREILKNFYDKRGEDGFFYAYLCPGMNKVLQSAGRVIRTDADEGVILLLDERFAGRRYREMFPAEWESPPTCTLGSVQRKLEEFWTRRHI